MMVGQRKDASVSYFAVATMCLFSIPHGASRRSSDDFLAGCVCVCVVLLLLSLPARLVGVGGRLFAPEAGAYICILYIVRLRLICVPSARAKKNKKNKKTEHGTARSARSHARTEQLNGCTEAETGPMVRPLGRAVRCVLSGAARRSVCFSRAFARSVCSFPRWRETIARARARAHAGVPRCQIRVAKNNVGSQVTGMDKGRGGGGRGMGGESSLSLALLCRTSA